MRTFLLLIILLLAGNAFGQNSRFVKKFENISGALTGAVVYIVNEATGDSLLLNEDVNSPGRYYRDNVAYGDYTIWVNGVIAEYGYYHGTKRQRSFIEAVDADGDNYIDAGLLENGTVSLQKLTSSLKAYIQASGGGVIDDIPDEVTITRNADSTWSLKNSSVDEVHLSANAKAWIQTQGATDLYNYQDASINEALQMHVRWAHYWFDKYYTDTDTSLTYDYDGSDPIYIGDRRQIVGYIKLLQVLHELTGDSRYWNRMVDLVNKMDGTRIRAVEKGGGAGSDTAWTYNMHSNTNWTYWSYDDCRMHEIKYYMYNQDPTTYASYLDEIKSFANVAYSYIDKDAAGVDGWGWAYKWNGDIAATADFQIVNVCAPFLPFYATLKANNIIPGDNITTTAVYDSILDSTWAYIEGAWITKKVDSTGGWGYNYADAGTGLISLEYNYANSLSALEAAEILGDTGFVVNNVDRLRMSSNYVTELNGLNYNYMRSYYSMLQSILLKWLEKHSVPVINDSMRQSYIGNFLYPLGYSGSGSYVESTIIGAQRRVSNRVGWLPLALKYFNNNSWAETWNHHAAPATVAMGANGWATNQTGYFLSDGNLIYQKQWLGVNSAGTSQWMLAGFYHGDTSPAGGNPDTATANSSNVVEWRVPQSGTTSNGLSYQVKHRYGTPFVHVTPSAPDSFWINIDDPGDAVGDSLYFFYFNAAGVLDTLNNSRFTIGDSVQVDLTKGLWIQGVATTPASQRHQGLFVLANHKAAWIVAGPDNGTTKRYTLSSTTLVDSAMFGIVYHQQGNWFLYNPIATGWQYAFAASRDILARVRKVWQNGLGYDGLLEDKTQ